jgi:hypothetical protein
MGILHGSRKESPSARGNVKPDVRPPLRREGWSFDRGGLFGDLKLEGLDAAQMNDLGGVTDEILVAQMKILGEKRFLTVGKTPWVKIWMMMSHFLEKGLTSL